MSKVKDPDPDLGIGRHLGDTGFGGRRGDFGDGLTCGGRPRAPSVSNEPWPVRLSPQAAKALGDLPDHAKEMLRDLLDIAARSPWGFPQWNATDFGSSG
ncbi:hypothetical protein [Streptomyces sp. NBC_01768]|uniref:hypothetical protein n=1 Tax=Streptomyces sp. NBC_01768 TaxID=2975938 RepID=UPI002DDAC223|nr:hypothetical protein [Streptomyces sp. NBC_01768]WSC25452.1 hypothetical protein OG902_01330 [Streptomyces sp. NBC_01768]